MNPSLTPAQTYHVVGPNRCPKCGSKHVTTGHTTIENEPVWICDECGVMVAWRDTRAR